VLRDSPTVDGLAPRLSDANALLVTQCSCALVGRRADRVAAECISRTSGVSIGPGAIALTRISCGTSSTAMTPRHLNDPGLRRAICDTTGIASDAGERKYYPLIQGFLTNHPQIFFRSTIQSHEKMNPCASTRLRCRPFAMVFIPTQINARDQ
jgi:hypothetical protein